MTDPELRRVEPTGNPRVDALIDGLVCPSCRTIYNAAKAGCTDLWHYDNRTVTWGEASELATATMAEQEARRSALAAREADQPTPFVPANLLAARADMRIEVVKRELNQGALAGFDSAVTDYAARLVVAALDSYDATALTEVYNRGVKDGKVLQTIFGSSVENLQAEHERGVAEGRRQATEGWKREWSARPPGHGYASTVDGEQVPYLREDGWTICERLVGQWEPTEQPAARELGVQEDNHGQA